MTIVSYNIKGSLSKSEFPDFNPTEATVILPSLMSVNEDDKVVNVCATLMVKEETEKELTLVITTREGEGTRY